MQDHHHMPHGGDIAALAAQAGRDPEQITDFSANINPLGFPEWLRPLISSVLGSVIHYPDLKCSGLIRAACQRYGALPEEVLPGNGTAEIINLLPRAMSHDRAVIPVPTYADYARACQSAGIETENLYLDPDRNFLLDPEELASRLSGNELVFICRPNNPTGISPDGPGLRRLARQHPRCTFVVDEAFGDFVSGLDSLTRDRPPNVILLLSLTKIFALPGLRIGIALADPEIVRSASGLQPNWSVNTLAQAAGEHALLDTDFIQRTREYVDSWREQLAEKLSGLSGIKVYPGEANFLLLRLERKDLSASELADKLLKRFGLAVRVCANFQGLDDSYLRVAVRTHPENEHLVRSLASLLRDRPPRLPRPRTPAVMFQGTSSNAGKSILAAAMCRILHRDGYSVAPFKAQNMSLNSFVTSQGGEMGRAQVVQAQAARVEPDVRMNPVLLKPGSETGCQVIINGRAVGNMGATGYVEYKPWAAAAAKEAYDSLRGEFDALVLEGAGSPGEINLKSHDIVNMAMARHAGSPVLLVGDIDRGGVFASFVGTMEVLEEWERRLIHGFVVNKFRGDVDLLGNAFELTLRHTRRPVTGVIPYFSELMIPDEDSVGWKEGLGSGKDPDPDCVRIGVVDLPHISNFTDFDALRMEPDVDLITIRSPEDLQDRDAVILPGSKNVFHDLDWLQHTGLDQAIRQMGETGRFETIGICGGLQMLGKEISDPHKLESRGRNLPGIGLLDLHTSLAPEKTLTRITAVHLESGLEVTGYEIHHGQSRLADQPLLRLPGGDHEGLRTRDGLVWGSYMHGIFDADEFRRWFVDRLRRRKGLKPKEKICSVYNPDLALDRLADQVRKCLDLKQIYQWMGL